MTENPDLLQQFMNALPGQLVFNLDEKYRLIRCNASFEQRFGLTADPDQILPVDRIFPLKSGRSAESVFKRVLEGHNEKDQTENTGTSAEITAFTLFLRPILIDAKTRHILGVLIQNSFIMSENVRYSIDVYHSLMEILPDSVLILGTDGTIKDFSRQSLKILGTRINSDLLNKSIYDFISMRDKEGFQKQLNSLADQTGYLRSETTFVPKIGDRFIGDTHMALMTRGESKMDRIIITIRDMGKYRDMIQNLEYRLEEFKKMLNYQPSYIWSKKMYENGQELFSYMSPVVEQVTGYPKEFFNNDPKSILNIVYKDDIAFVAEHFENFNSAFDEAVSFEFRIIHADKSIRWLRSDMVVDYLPTGFRQIITATTDITDQKTAEIELERSERKYRLISENTRDVIWTADFNRNFTFVSPSVFSMTGYEPDYFIENDVNKLFEATTTDKLKKQFDSLLEENRGMTAPILYQAKFFRKDGSEGWCEIKMSQFYNKGKLEGIQGSFNDISQRKHIERVLISEQKSAVDKLLGTQSLFFRVDGNGHVLSHSGKMISDFQDIANGGKSLFSCFSGDSALTLNDLFEENPDCVCDKILSTENGTYRLFGTRHGDSADIFLLDQSELARHREHLIENISMIQLILWS